MWNHDAEVDRIRRFERIFERRLRKIHRSAASEDFTVADLRIIAEVGHAKGARSGAWLAGVLHVDTGYLCRTLRKLEAYGLLSCQPSSADRRTRDWELTADGLAFASRLELERRERVQRDLAELPPAEKRQLFEALAVVEAVLLSLEMTRAWRG
jgi:DNA-binding MarR family transcriptional regulator